MWQLARFIILHYGAKTVQPNKFYTFLFDENVKWVTIESTKRALRVSVNFSQKKKILLINNNTIKLLIIHNYQFIIILSPPKKKNNYSNMYTLSTI